MENMLMLFFIAKKCEIFERIDNAKKKNQPTIIFLGPITAP